MKIIHLVLGKANPQRMNGVNKVANKLVETQFELGYDVALWGIANDTEHNYPERSYPTYLFQQQRNPFGISKSLRTAIEEQDSEVVFHIHGAFIPCFYTICKLLTKRGIDYIFTPHGSFTEGAVQRSYWRKKVYTQLFERHLITRAKFVQALGIMEQEYITNQFPKTKVVLVPNGQDLSEIPACQSPNNEVIHFGFCGRIDINHKGLDLLLEGFEKYLDKGLKGKLFFIGGGSDKANFEQLVEDKGLSNHILFHGPLFGEEKFQALSKCDIFVHTSRMEGFPLAVLEAAAMEKPCLISTATSVVPYLDQYQAGFSLRENTPGAICKAMMDAASQHMDGQLEQLGKNAALMVEKVFNWTDIASKMVRVYEQ